MYLWTSPKIRKYPLFLSFFRCQFCHFCAAMTLSGTAPATPPKAVFKVKNSGKSRTIFRLTLTRPTPPGRQIP